MRPPERTRVRVSPGAPALLAVFVWLSSPEVLGAVLLAAPLWQVAGGAVLAAVWAAFIAWTFAPPELPLFVDPETGLRGIR